MTEDSDSILVRSTPRKWSSGHLLTGSSINGMNFAQRYKAVTKTTDRRTKRLLHIGDTVLSLLVITPLVVAHWRGTWSYMDHREEHFPPWNCFILGGVLHTVFALLREFLHTEFSASNGVKSWRRTLTRHVVVKLYTYVFSAGCILHWRGGWAVLTLYFEETLWNYVIITVVTLVPLIVLRSVRNTLAAPYVIINDFKDCTFAFPTRFRIVGTRQPGLYVLDCMFSVLVVGTLVVFVWRGIWVFLDIVIYPDNKTLSALSSLAIGYGVVAVTFALQPAMRWTCERLTGLWRLATADLFLFFSFLGTINVWRGVWYLLDVYFIPENPLMSDLVTHGVSLLLLALLNCSNTVLVRGVYIDAEEPDGQCVIFPVYYIRLFFQKERLKKQKRQLDLEKGALHHHLHHHHHHSLRQQLLRSNEKTPIIVPMQKMTPSQQINSNLFGQTNCFQNNSPTAIPICPEEDWRLSVPPVDEEESAGDVGHGESEGEVVDAEEATRRLTSDEGGQRKAKKGVEEEQQQQDK